MTSLLPGKLPPLCLPGNAHGDHVRGGDVLALPVAARHEAKRAFIGDAERYASLREKSARNVRARSMFVGFDRLTPDQCSQTPGWFRKLCKMPFVLMA